MPQVAPLLSLLGVLATCTVIRATPLGRPAPVYGPPLSQLPTPPPPPPAYIAPAPYQLAPPRFPPGPHRYQYPAAPGYQRYQQPSGTPGRLPQQHRVEQQGLWRYRAPVRDIPLREDQVPHQGLGASESVTMPEAPPYDPVLVTGPAASHFVQRLSTREPYFFPDFPHTRLVLNNQQHRLNNGLHAHRIGSIRPGSDFVRLD